MSDKQSTNYVDPPKILDIIINEIKSEIKKVRMDFINKYAEILHEIKMTKKEIKNLRARILQGLP